jgi:hypothetical protein
VPVWGIEEQLDAIFSYTSVARRALLTIATFGDSMEIPARWRLRTEPGIGGTQGGLRALQIGGSSDRPHPNVGLTPVS